MSSIKMRQHVERQIARRFILDAIAAGYSISVNNGGDEDEIPPSNNAKEILGAMFAADEDRLFVHKNNKRIGWVYFIYGNDGWDVISDYTTNLDNLGLMAGAAKLADKYGD